MSSTYAVMVPTSSTKFKLDNKLLTPFYDLLSSDEPQVLLGLVHALPAFINHGCFSSLLMLHYTSLVFHDNLLVQSTAAGVIPLLGLVRMADDEGAGSHHSTLRFMLQSLLKITRDSSLVAQKTVQTGIILFIKQIVQLSSPGSCVYVLLALMHCLSLTEHRNVVAEVHLAVAALAQRCGLTPGQLVHQNRQIVCKVLVERAREDTLEMILCHAAEVFRDSEFTDVRRLFDSSLLDQLEFTSSYFRHLLCPLVVRAAKEECPGLVMALLGCIAKGEELNNQVAAAVGGCGGPADTSVPAAAAGGGGKKQPISLLIDHFQHIVVHAAFLYPVEVVEKCIQFVADSTGSHPISIHLCSMQNQVNELVLGLGEFRDRSLQELECLTVLENISADKETSIRLDKLLAQHKQIRRRPASVSAVRGFLTKRFLGVLVFLDSKLVSVNSMPHERELAVLGLTEVVSVVGREGVTGMARKLLATLKLAVDHTPPSFSKQCALAWRQYIYYLQPDKVGSLVEEILVSVCPLLTTYPLTLGPTVNRLLSQFPELSGVVAHLPPLPDIPQLKRLNTAIKEYGQLGKKGYTEQQLLSVVSSCTAGLRHDSCDVRKHSLYRLLHVLRTRHAQLCALALNRDSPHAALSELCIALIAQCRTPHEDLQVLVAEALGLLGAIDPARLIRVEQLQQDQFRRVHASLTSPGFIRDLVTELARAFLAATDSAIQNCASFAMQELLRIHDIRAAPSSATTTTSRAGSGGSAAKSLGVQVWELLPQHVQELLRPLYTSKYIMSGGTGEANSFRRRPKVAADAAWNPIYGTREGKSFKLWLTAWLSQLLTLVENDKDHEVFSACRPIFRRDTNTALHILPPIIMSVLLHSPQHHAKVASEVLAVMAGVQHSSHDQRSSSESIYRSCPEDQQKGLDHTPTKKERGDETQSKMDSLALAAHMPDRQLQQLCVETVFSVLDALNVWVQQRWTEEAGSKKHKTAFVPSTELQQMIDFLTVLPSEQLARTAFKCQAYTRALRHIEDHIRNRPDTLSSHLTFMQQVFNALDEPEGVKGIASIRSSEPSVHDHILLYKANGRVHDALGCYEYLCSQKKSRQPSADGCVTSSGPKRPLCRSNDQQPPLTDAGCALEASACDGLLLEDDPHVGLLQCYISLDQPQSVLDITHALINKNPREQARLSEFRMEAAWRLFRWDDLEEMLNSCQGERQPSSAVVARSSRHPKLGLSGVAASWGEGVAEVLVSIRKGLVGDYLKGLERLRKQIIPLISAATMEKGAYQRAYPYLLKLHILSELEDLMSGFLQLGTGARENGGGRPIPGREELRPLAFTVDQLVQKWDDRLDLIQTSYKNLEPVLSFRRTLLMLAREVFVGPDEVKDQLQAEVERCWLQTAKVARKAGMLQQGETAFLQAGVGRDVFVERAKWMQAKGDVIAGLDVLRRGIAKHFPRAVDYKADTCGETRPERMACSRAQLLLAKCSEEAAILDVNSLMLRYRDSSEIDRDSEDGHFHFAMYLDRILACRREKSIEYRYHIVASLNKALSSGNKHLYESLPRMLTIWLELGTLVAQHEAGAKKAPSVQLNVHREKLSQMNALIGGTVDTLCLYQLMTALPQFISRICHSHPGVFKQISVIIATLMAAYPQQAMWHMIAVSKSSFNVRVQRCLETFEAAKRKRPGLAKLITDSTKLADRFIELSNKQVEKGTTIVSVSALVRSLPRLLSECDFSNVLIPTQYQMTVRLPATQHRTFARAPTQCMGLDDAHKPFPSNEVYISGIEDQAEVMASLQQPKKIVLKGSDGRSYILMCKPKDDLRKDGRLMDFTRFVNRLLVRDPDSRGRDLTIRTYGVVPLNEECGLMEWVHNLNGLRNVLHKIYREKGMYMPATELRLYMCKQEVPIENKLDIFLNKLKARHPPVLAEWFLKTFPHPHTWYHGRRAYCHTAGVMSMVGYVLGLGDRHGENLNLDSMTGDLVHVDFNCLFNKGESFDWPERVPFRLTHNMVEAMGHGALDGLFRAACLITMRIMREEREALMSVLKPFIHDPLVEWSKGDKLAKNTGEICNEKAQLHVRDIELRLKGVIASKARGFNIPLSVEGQVDLLISDATSDKNLCQMYIGWAPYL